MPLNKQIIQGVFCAKFKFIVNMPVKERLTELECQVPILHLSENPYSQTNSKELP